MQPPFLFGFIVIFAMTVTGGCGDSSSSSLTNDAFDVDSTAQLPPQPEPPQPDADEEENASPEAEQPGLTRFASAEELAVFLTERSLAEPSAPTGPTGIFGPVGAEGPAGPASAVAPDDFSTTTLQEVGVDESDVVKNDGTHAFVLKNSEVRIVRIQPVETIQQVASVPIEGFGTALFLRENMLIALSVTSGSFGIPEPIALTEPSPRRRVDVSRTRESALHVAGGDDHPAGRDGNLEREGLELGRRVVPQDRAGHGGEVRADEEAAGDRRASAVALQPVRIGPGRVREESAVHHGGALPHQRVPEDVLVRQM